MITGVVNEEFEPIIPISLYDSDGNVYINESETVPLIVMQLLRGYDLRIQAIEGGSVTIEALSLA
jgi:hypothetical protein